MKKIFVTISLLFVLFLGACGNQNKGINDYIRFGGIDNADNVRARFFLTQAINDEKISWEVSNSDVINITNIANIKINRPENGQPKVHVELTATHGKTVKTFKLTVLPLSKDSILNEYPTLRTTNHIIEEVDYDRLLELLEEKAPTLIYLGFSECPYCQEYLPYFEEIARQRGYEGKIYYYNFSEIRHFVEENGEKFVNPLFQEIINIIEKHYSINETKDGFKWLLAPTFLSVNNKKVKKLFTGAVEGHVASLSALNDSQKEWFKSEIESIVKQVIDCGC